MTTVLVTPDTRFGGELKRAFDGDFDSEQWWDDALGRLHPHQVAETIASSDPDVVVLGPGLTLPQSLDLAAAFDVLYPEICVVLAAKPTARLWERALQAGIRDILIPGATDEELREVITRARAVAERRRTSNHARESREVRHGRVLTVLSSKGGSGKTTMATNLAVGLAKAAPGKVVIVDLDLQFGDVASALQLVPQSTMADVARVNGKLDATALKVFLEPHPSGLYALCGPQFPAEAEEVSATTVGHVIELLASEFDYVVVDTAAGLDEHALAAAERSTDLVLVCATDVPAVRGLRKAVDALDLLDMTEAHRHLILNRADARVGLNARDIEATLGIGIDLGVPSSRSVPISMNQGSPVIESDPKSPVARALTQLVYRFFVSSSPAQNNGAKARR